MAKNPLRDSLLWLIAEQKAGQGACAMALRTSPGGKFHLKRYKNACLLEELVLGGADDLRNLFATAATES